MAKSTRKAIDLDLPWINSILVSPDCVINAVMANDLTDKAIISKHSTKDWLLKAITLIDLASLVGNETPEDIQELCEKAKCPLNGASKTPEDFKVQCAAVCVYPSRIQDASKALTAHEAGGPIWIASVAAGFPSGQFPLHTRLAEIYYAIANNAQEIDVVIDRSLVLQGLWPQLYNEIVEMRKACGSVCLKVILSVTECGSWANIFRASIVAMMAGADFIKSSTGKEATTMTIHEGLVMCLAVKDFHIRTGIKVGLKPAGGVKTVESVISWMYMVKQMLGEEWLTPTLFRIGTSYTSALIGNIDDALNE